MKVEANATFPYPRRVVWEKLMDFEILSRTLPGVKKMTPVTPDKCDVAVKVLGPAITGDYAGTVEVVDKHPIDDYRLVGQVKGRLGWVKGGAVFRLADEAGGTRLDAEIEVNAGGVIITVGGRFMEGIAKVMIRDFFSNFEKELASTASETQARLP